MEYFFEFVVGYFFLGFCVAGIVIHSLLLQANCVPARIHKPDPFYRSLLFVLLIVVVFWLPFVLFSSTFREDLTYGLTVRSDGK